MSLRDFKWLDLSDLISDEVSGTGWDELLTQLLNEIALILEGSQSKLRLRQVKEKFGALRFYWRLEGAASSVITRIAAVVDRAMDASERTCFKCGQAAEVRKLDGWIVPLCDRHAKMGRDAFPWAHGLSPY